MYTIHRCYWQLISFLSKNPLRDRCKDQFFLQMIKDTRVVVNRMRGNEQGTRLM